MKKEYSKPEIELIQVNLDTIICGTGTNLLSLNLFDSGMYEEEEAPEATTTIWGTGIFGE